jgi:hypothetical protein
MLPFKRLGYNNSLNIAFFILVSFEIFLYFIYLYTFILVNYFILTQSGIIFIIIGKRLIKSSML